jgi:hypothetical protein
MKIFDERVAELDVTLFDRIKSQSTCGDKRSWLAMQHAVRDAKHTFTYLEIGSYLGGSIQPYVLDPKCRVIYSIDKRPEEQPDDRGQVFSYRDSSTQRMLANLQGVDPHQVRKVICFDSAAANVDALAIADPPDLCLIDGEHTRSAVLDDFAFCARVSAPDAVICFHDADVICPAIATIVSALKRKRARFRALKLGGLTYAIALGSGDAITDRLVQGIASDGEEFLRAMRLRRWRERLGRYAPAFVKPALRAVRAGFART